MNLKGSVWGHGGGVPTTWTTSNPEAVHNPCEGACYHPLFEKTAGPGETNDKRGVKVWDIQGFSESVDLICPGVTRMRVSVSKDGIEKRPVIHPFPSLPGVLLC